MLRHISKTWQHSVIGAALATVLAGVPGCMGPLMIPMVRPLGEEQQAQVEEAWSKICTPPGGLDRVLLLDVLIAGQLHHAGVDSLDLVSQKRVSGGGTAIMETHYRRSDPNAARYVVTFLDAHGQLVRRETYTPDEVDGRAQYLSMGGYVALEPNEPTAEEREDARRRRAEYKARIAEIRAVLGGICPHTWPDSSDDDEHVGQGGAGADSTALSDEQRRAKARGVASIVDELQGGRTPEEVLAVITQHFGPPDREAGSGLSIPQWDLADGLLTYHPMCGPTLRHKDGRTEWLIKTHNPLRESLLGSFELTTAPDEKGNRVWLGNVFLNPDGTYAFKGGGMDPNLVVEHENFFTGHPAGTFKVHDRAGMTDMALLETLASQTVVASLEFTAPNPKATTTEPDRGGASDRLSGAPVFSIVDFAYEVTADPDGRRLSVGPREEFEMTKGWEHYWW